jgi:hypothetical protein
VFEVAFFINFEEVWRAFWRGAEIQDLLAKIWLIWLEVASGAFGSDSFCEFVGYGTL